MVVNMGLDPHNAEYFEKRYRIAVDNFSRCAHPIISLDRESLIPTNIIEIRQFWSYTEYVFKRKYGLFRWESILESGLPPTHSGHNTVIFKKAVSKIGARWYFRKRTGQKKFVPDAPNGDRDLVKILDRVERIHFDKWKSWKMAHGDIFPPS